MHTLVHLSDVHLGGDRKPKPVAKLAAAVWGIDHEPSSVAVVVTGDVAYSGEPGQYEQARAYLIELRDAIRRECRVECQIIACPGNHDCNFPEDAAVRNLVVEQIRSDASLPDSQDMIRQCTGVQDAFFEWLESCGSLAPRPPSRLAWTAQYQAGDGTRLGFRVLNTGWMSTIREEQGRLYYPVAEIPELASADVVVSLLHHPYSWFQSANARDLRRQLEAASDLVLTGHEHDCDSYAVSRPRDEHTVYVEGASFCGDDREPASFSVIQVDPGGERYRVNSFAWDGDTFVCDSAEANWEGFVFARSRFAREQLLSSDMQDFLNDLGMHLTHHAKALALDDIFVAPELRTYDRLDDRDETALERSSVPSEVCISRLLDDRYAYLLGDTQCGKTALAKVLFAHALRSQQTPVLLQGDHIGRIEPADLRRSVNEAVKNQYAHLSPEAFWQIAAENRTVIVDDFGQAPLNIRGKAQVAEWLRSSFGRVFLLGGGLSQIEDVIAAHSDEETLTGFCRYEIRPFGHELRDRLIEKWLRLGQEHQIEQDDLYHRLREAASTVNRLLGDNLLPASPVYILLLLQQIEAEVPLDTSAGSYGYFYEALVTMALQRSARSPEDVDTKYTYLSELASTLFT